MERFLSDAKAVVTEGIPGLFQEVTAELESTLDEVFSNTHESNDDLPAAPAVDQDIPSLECDDDELRAIAKDYNRDGDARLKKNEFDNAADFYTKGIDLKCKDEELNGTMYTNRARVHFCVGNYNEALIDVKAAREFLPLHLEAIETGASTYMELDLYNDAVKWCDEGLAIDNTNKKLRDLKSSSLKIQAYQEIGTDDDNVLRGIADGHNKDGDEEMRKYEYDSAIYCYTEGIKVNCKDDKLNALLYTNRANVHFSKGNYNEALSDAKCARKFQPTCVKAIEKGASACFELDMFEEAFTWCNDGLAIDKDDGALLELRDKLSLFELSQCRKADRKKAPAAQSQNKPGFLDWSLKKVMAFSTNYCRALARMVAGNEYDTVYSKVDFKVYSMKPMKGSMKAAEVLSRSLLRGAEGNAEHGGGQVAGLTYVPGADDIQEIIDHFEQELRLSKNSGYKVGEGRAYDNLGKTFQMRGDFKQAIEYHKEHLNIAQELGDRAGEGSAYGNLGTAYLSLNDIEEAVAFFKLALSIAKEVGQRTSEGRACNNLGDAYLTQGKFEDAEEYFKQHLSIAKEVRDRAGEGLACGNLGLVYGFKGEFQQALEYGQQYLSIAKEVGNRAWEAEAYGKLGNAYHNLSDLEQAIYYYRLQLSLVNEMGFRQEEGQVYCNLGNACRDFKQAAEYHRLSLNIDKELGDRTAEGCAYGNLSDDYYNLDDYKQAVEYGTLNLAISKEVGLKNEEAASYQRLGNAFLVLANFEQALYYYNLLLDAAKEAQDLSGEGRAYGLIGSACQSLGHFKRAIDYHQRHLYIAEVMEEVSEQGCAYGNIGLAYQSLEDIKQAIECFEKHLSITKKVEDRVNEGIVYGNLGEAYLSLDDFQQAIHYQQLRLKIAEEVDSKVEQGNAYYALGCVNEQTENLPEALECFQSSVQRFKCVTALLQSKDDWKISFQDGYQSAHIALWRVLLKQNKFKEALLAAEEGRAQALMDLMKSLYGLQANISQSDVQEESILDVHTNALFLALDENKINCWLLLKNNDVCFRTEEIESINERIFEEIEIDAAVRCEDRSLDMLRKGAVVNKKTDPKMPQSSHCKTSVLRWLYDIIIRPFADLIEGDELIIVPDGPLCLIPFCVLVDTNSRYLCETFRLRVVPSLSSLRLILNSSEQYHSRHGALLVGDPCVEEVVLGNGEELLQLPFAKKEVEMIGDILQTDPIIGTRATKDEVLRRLNRVALVHIAAHGSMETGEIALCPNPRRASQIPEKEDFLLTMSDVLNVKLRARLVVLSCCHSGKGKVKAEGVVGIARAFLAAGARSVLVSLWAIDDEATLAFMESFYQHLLVGGSASESLNQAMKCLRESHKYSAMKHWAPFVLIGDDVTIDFASAACST